MEAAKVADCVRRIAKEFGYETKSRLAWKKGRELTTLVQTKKLTTVPAIEIAFGSLPNAYFVDGLPKAEGGWGCIGWADRLTGTEFHDVFAKLADYQVEHDVEPEILKIATVSLFRWIEQHLVDEEQLKADLLTPDSWVKQIGFPHGLMELWARGTLRVEDWPMYRC